MACSMCELRRVHIDPPHMMLCTAVQRCVHTGPQPYIKLCQCFFDHF